MKTVADRVEFNVKPGLAVKGLKSPCLPFVALHACAKMRSVITNAGEYSKSLPHSVKNSYLCCSVII